MGFASHFGKPGRIAPCVVPSDINHRPPTTSPTVVVDHWRAIAIGDTGVPLIECHLELGVPKDEAQARKLFERAAEGGNPRGVTNLAALSDGGNTPSDPGKARAILAKAAEKNSAEAQYQLGLMIAEGVGGEKDDVAARALFEKAAAQDHPGALERMGAFAQSGRGGPQDTSAAKAYYEKAAALGNEDAKAALKRLQCRYAIKDKRGNVVTTLCF